MCVHHVAFHGHDYIFLSKFYIVLQWFSSCSVVFCAVQYTVSVFQNFADTISDICVDRHLSQWPCVSTGVGLLSQPCSWCFNSFSIWLMKGIYIVFCQQMSLVSLPSWHGLSAQSKQNSTF